MTTPSTVDAEAVRGLLAAIAASLDVPAAASHHDDDLRLQVLTARIDVIRRVIGALDAVDTLAVRYAAGYIEGHMEPVSYRPFLVKALAAAEASPANPYGSAKHGVYTAPSAAAVAQDVEPAVTR